MSAQLIGQSVGSLSLLTTVVVPRRDDVAIHINEITKPTTPTTIKMSPTTYQFTLAVWMLTANRKIAPAANNTIDVPILICPLLAVAKAHGAFTPSLPPLCVFCNKCGLVNDHAVNRVSRPGMGRWRRLARRLVTVAGVS
jgi:hypothetical protein